MNLPTVDLYFKVGRENLMKTCNKLRFPKFTDDAPSIALGTLDLSLYEIVRAYSAFANQGRMSELVMINKITDAKGNILYMNKQTAPVNVFSIETSQMITAMLQEVISQGTGTRIRSTYGISSELAGKTGTAQNYSDAWFVAYTPDMVVGTWVGARTPDVHFYSGNGSGASLALPVVGNIIRGIENDDKLRREFLTLFTFFSIDKSTMYCYPFLQKGVKGFFNRLFKGKDEKGNDSRNADKKEKKTKEEKSFFKKLFKRN
jgi:penicillin-binding protein 1A